ncbi:hypothetical protein ITX54_20980 [Rouxiella silvae]|uniref:Uncharacterized protein n=1 Tax=Rouxiella silvae TaxID=1646373 RepID=A0AA40X5P0_9GAMM|nr:hypothetical protein [Rouxiella silvae]MBF6639138.1 hypothetical protein [Rouxiella silvae]
MKTELNIFDGCCLKDILNMKISMGIKELYIEMNKGVINNFIRLENEKNIINESELCITPFSKRLVAKLSTREREVKIVELLSYLKMNDSIKALQLIQYIKMQNVLSNGDVCNLYSLYLKYLKSISPRFIDNNIFYLKRLVLGLISLNKINLIL